MEGSISFAVAFFAGLLSFLSPCVLPLVPSYLGFITGMTVEDLRAGAKRGPVMINALLFVGGFSLIFLLLGASATVLGQLLFRYQTWISRIGGLIVILFGLHLLGILRWSVLLRERRLQLRSRPAGYVGAVAAGAAFAAGWTPCIGPVLGAVLTYASTRATLGNGMLLLGSYALGLAVPFLLAAFATGKFLNTSRRVRRFLPWVERLAGAMLIVAGLLLVSGTFPVLSGYFARLTPDFLLDRL